MPFFKSLRCHHHAQGRTLDTHRVNYGNRFEGVTDADRRLHQVVLEISSASAVAFEPLTLFAQHIQSNQFDNKLLDLFELSPPSHKIDLADFARIGERGHMVSLGPLSYLVGGALQCNTEIGSSLYNASFWESLYELVRAKQFQDCPSRLASYFACTSTDAVRAYEHKHNGGMAADKMICELDVSQCTVAFRADMTILDRITPNANLQSAIPEVQRYWRQDMSEDPLVEVLLQGKVTLGAQETQSCTVVS